MKIYLAIGPSGDYDTYFEEILGAWVDEESAKEAGEKWYDGHANALNYAPMTKEEFEDLNGGYAKEDYDQEGPRCNLGKYALEDFEKMESILYMSEWENYYNPIIKEVELHNIDKLKKLLN